MAAVPAAGVLSGAAIGLFYPELPRAWVVSALIVSAAAVVCAWRRLRSDVFIAAVACVFFCGSALLAADAWRRAWRPPLRVAFEARARAERAEAARDGRRMPEDDEAFAIVEGILRSDAAPSDGGVSLSVDVDALPSCPACAASPSGPSRPSSPPLGHISVTVTGSLAAERMGEWRAGRRVRAPVQLRRPPRYLDPGVGDNERALARRHTTLVGSVKSGALVEVRAPANLLDQAIAEARAFSRRAIRDNVGRWSGRSAAIVAAIVIGDRAGLDADVERRLQEAGTYHVIAISGGNIAILAGLLLAAFRFAGWLGRTAMLASAAGLLLYATFVGGGASVDRATLMAVVYFCGRALDQRGPPLNALAVVAALLVASDPLAIADPAFLLTFGATLAILVIVPVAVGTTSGWMPAETRRAAATRTAVGWTMVRAAGRGATAMFAASAAAEALLFPIGALIFSRVTFAGLALNLVAIPLMGIAQIAGMAVVPIALVSSRAASCIGYIAHAGSAGLVSSAGLAGLAPALSYRVAPPSVMVIVLYYAAAASSWTLWRRRATKTGSSESRPARSARLATAAVTVAAAAWILIDPHTLVAGRGDGRLHVTAIDVGQGDATFVVFPLGATLLVDAGGLAASSSFDIGERVVAPVIRAAGFRRIDYLALTHGDPDHIGGAMAVVRELRPREVWEGIPVPRAEALTRLRVEAQAAGARWANVYAGDAVAIDGVDVVARHPRPAEWERQRVRNDDSIVLEVRWRDVSIVLTGDIGTATEREIAAAFAPSPLRVVKIPHHGSLTSSSDAFVRALAAQVAVVSAGRSNHFGHPVPEVLERYRESGAAVFRTDQDGAVTVDSDGYSVDVRTFQGRQLRLPRRHEDTK